MRVYLVELAGVLWLLLVGGSGALAAQAPADTLSAVYREAKGLFEEARAFQEKKDYASAIPLYQRLIHMDPTAPRITPPAETGMAGAAHGSMNPAGSDATAPTSDYADATLGKAPAPKISPATLHSVAGLMDDGCLQLVYCYIFSGVRGDGARYFSGVYGEEDNWLVRNRPRSVEICYAYSLYEATRLDEAVALVDKALGREEAGREDERIYVDNGIASVIYNQAGEIRKAIRCGERSLEILRRMDDKGKIVFVLGNLIYQYQQVGDFDKALGAYDELMASGEGEKNPYGLCAAEVNAVHLYDEWGLEDEVKIHLRKAREAATKSGVPDAFLRVDNLAAYFALENGDHATATALLDSLKARIPDPEQDSYYHDFYENYRCILAVRTSADNDPAPIAEARRRIAALKDERPSNLSVLSCRLLGDALAAKGHDRLAIEAYEHCCDYIRKNHLLNQQRLIFAALGDLYAKRGDYQASSRYYSEAREAATAFTDRRNNRMLAQFRVKYETLEKERANQLLRSEIRLKERTLQYYLWLGISVMLLGVLFFVWLVMRNRAMKLRHEADRRQHELDEVRHAESLRLIERKEEQLRNMLVERQQLNRQQEELLARIEAMDSRNNLEEVISSLKPCLLTAEEELEFRRQFAAVHPGYLSRLREACPSVTRGEELLAMLLRLNLTSDEIALALGNTRASVNTARFRLRKKFSIEKDQSLEAFLSTL